MGSCKWAVIVPAFWRSGLLVNMEEVRKWWVYYSSLERSRLEALRTFGGKLPALGQPLSTDLQADQCFPECHRSNPFAGFGAKCTKASSLGWGEMDSKPPNSSTSTCLSWPPISPSTLTPLQFYSTTKQMCNIQGLAAALNILRYFKEFIVTSLITYYLSQSIIY